MLWDQRRILYEQCMDVQLFYRDTEQADAWMSKQEVSYIWAKTLGTIYSLWMFFVLAPELEILLS